MKRIVGSSAVALLFSFTLAAETFNGIVLDVMCQSGFETYTKAKGHTKACSLMPPCVASGFGVVTEDDKFLKFDAEGNKKAEAAIKASDKTTDVRVVVDGKLDGDVIAVTDVKIAD
jgi:hypothetical protein